MLIFMQLQLLTASLNWIHFTHSSTCPALISERCSKRWIWDAIYIDWEPG